MKILILLTMLLTGCATRSLRQSHETFWDSNYVMVSKSTAMELVRSVKVKPCIDESRDCDDIALRAMLDIREEAIKSLLVGRGEALAVFVANVEWGKDSQHFVLMFILADESRIYVEPTAKYILKNPKVVHVYG